MIIDKTFGIKEPNVNYYDRQGVYLIAIQNENVATVKTPKGYFLIGGGIESKENHIQCIERESLEEIGYRIVVKNHILKYSVSSLPNRSFKRSLDHRSKASKFAKKSPF